MLGHRPPVLLDPGREILKGHHPCATETSSSRGWRGVMVEFYRDCEADFTAVFANHGIRLHLAGSMDLYQRSEGKALQTEMHPGNISISPAVVPKSIQYKRGGEFVLVHIAPALVQEIAADMKDGSLDVVELQPAFCTRDSHIERLCVQLLEEYRNSDLASGINAEALVTQLSVHLIRRYSNLRTSENVESIKLAARALQRAIDFIESHLGSDVTIGDVAKELSISTAHFGHAFRGSMGVPPHRYIVERRIELARTLLRDTLLPIATVAVRVGFSTHAHFCVVFQRTTGFKPSQYRKAFLSGR